MKYIYLNDRYKYLYLNIFCKIRPSTYFEYFKLVNEYTDISLANIKKLPLYISFYYSDYSCYELTYNKTTKIPCDEDSLTMFQSFIEVDDNMSISAMFFALVTPQIFVVRDFGYSSHPESHMEKRIVHIQENLLSIRDQPHTKEELVLLTLESYEHNSLILEL